MTEKDKENPYASKRSTDCTKYKVGLNHCQVIGYTFVRDKFIKVTNNL